MMKVLTKVTLLSLALVLIGGCVSKASGVAAAFVDPLKYKDESCDELLTGKHERETALAILSKKQDNARTRAITYNLLLIVGSGALVKDRADQIAIVKGEIAAIESNMVRRCGGSG